MAHHALCNLIEPIFERQFIPDSYANRKHKGTHRAVNRLQALARRYRYVLRVDIVKHFPSIDHVVLYDVLAETIKDDAVRWLVERIIRSGEGVLDVVKFSRRLRARWAEYCAGKITFAEFDASVQGWINQFRYADTWGLRTHVLGQGLVFRKPASSQYRE